MIEDQTFTLWLMLITGEYGVENIRIELRMTAEVLFTSCIFKIKHLHNYLCEYWQKWVKMNESWDNNQMTIFYLLPVSSNNKYLRLT